jgi:hypothetical protein
MLGRPPVRIQEELVTPLAALGAGKGTPVAVEAGSPIENICRRVEVLWSLRSRLGDPQRRQKWDLSWRAGGMGDLCDRQMLLLWKQAQQEVRQHWFID